MTPDVWTSSNRFSVLRITCHWIDGNWQLRELVLDASELKGPHSGKNMARHVLEILNEFNKSEKNSTSPVTMLPLTKGYERS